jgi:hypothetical protein
MMKNGDTSGTINLSPEKAEKEFVITERLLELLKPDRISEVQRANVVDFNEVAWLFGSRLLSMIDSNTVDDNENLKWGYWFLQVLEDNKRLLPMCCVDGQIFWLSEVQKIMVELELFPHIEISHNDEVLHVVIDAFDCPFGLKAEAIKKLS